ncbi:5'-methylthioadenosine/adenosylhomocysteine nucleosidase [Clostridiales bacterium COT073_COT-073]|nr:5'-methylthioadenosine/adenosylhomocysteine nucleosidase [Clostridiales bacterium COT073_COT-073]
MKLIGIIGAMEEEVLVLREQMTITDVRSIAQIEYAKGNLGNREIVLAKSGIGKVNAAVCAQIMIDIFKVDALINLGVAGALSPQLNICDVIISKEFVQHDVDVTAFGYNKGEIPQMETSVFRADSHLIHLVEKASEVLDSRTQVKTGRILSGDQFISKTEDKEWLYQFYGGECTEMEGAAIAQVCHLNRVAFVGIRSVSDKADNSADMDFNEFTKQAAFNSSKLLLKLLTLL